MLVLTQEVRERLRYLKSYIGLSVEFIDAILQDRVELADDRICYLPDHADNVVKILSEATIIMKEIRNQINDSELLTVHIIYLQDNVEFSRESFSTPFAARDHLRYMRKQYGPKFMRGKGQRVSFHFERIPA